MINRRQALTAGAAWFASAALPQPKLHAAEKICWRDGRVRLPNGCWLGYREYGQADGPPVFYFHGTPGSRLELALCDVEASQSGLRVISIDRPGMGRSSYQGCRRIVDWPCQVEQFADALGYGGQPFGVIGMSGGAPYATACAAKIPHRLTHVAIVSGHAPLCAPGTCPGNQDELIKLVSRRPRLSKMVFGLIGRRLQRKPDKIVKMISKKWTAADRRLILCNPRRYRQLIANLQEASRCGPAGVVKDIRLLACNWGFRLSDIAGVPVSIWQGCCDKTVTPSMARYFQQRIAGSELIYDCKAGHVTMLKTHIREILSRFYV